MLDNKTRQAIWQQSPMGWVKCGHCGTRRREKDMEIYDVHSDKYFCNQDCLDAENGIIRDAEGYVSSMI